MSERSVCIIDFCGGYRSEKYGYFYPVSMSADYFPDESLTYFTGLWCEVPPMPSPSEPTESQCEDWAAKYGTLDEFLDRALAHDTR